MLNWEEKKPSERDGFLATRNGLEPSTSSVTGWRANRLHHRARTDGIIAWICGFVKGYFRKVYGIWERKGFWLKTGKVLCIMMMILKPRGEMK